MNYKYLKAQQIKSHNKEYN